MWRAMSLSARESLWMFEVYREWILEIHEDHMRYFDYYEGVAEVAFDVDVL